MDYNLWLAHLAAIKEEINALREQKQSIDLKIRYLKDKKAKLVAERYSGDQQSKPSDDGDDPEITRRFNAFIDDNRSPEVKGEWCEHCMQVVELGVRAEHIRGERASS